MFDNLPNLREWVYPTVDDPLIIDEDVYTYHTWIELPDGVTIRSDQLDGLG